MNINITLWNETSSVEAQVDFVGWDEWVVILITSIASRGQYGDHLGPTGPRWVPCWPLELCYLGSLRILVYMCLWPLDFRHQRRTERSYGAYLSQFEGFLSKTRIRISGKNTYHSLKVLPISQTAWIIAILADVWRGAFHALLNYFSRNIISLSVGYFC